VIVGTALTYSRNGPLAVRRFAREEGGVDKSIYNMHNICISVWDIAKARANYRKHRVLFGDAETVFNDPVSLSIEDDRYGEQRFVTIGMDLKGRILVVVHAYPEGSESTRLISARRATPSERRQYEQGTK
jgi:uncharacterized DUF497 family protein